MGKSLVRISIASLLVIYILIGSLFSSVSSVAANEATNVILVGWDGVQRNHLFELLNRDELPDLKALINEGTIVNITVIDHSTDTSGGWTQILTGYRWWNTGVYSNDYWFHSIPDSYTIPERVESYFGKDNVATAFITGSLSHMEVKDWTRSALYGTYTHEAIYSHIPSKVDVCSVAYRNANVVGSLTLQFLENYSNRHFFAFFHFVDPDLAGHVPQGGENSALYEEGIKMCDYWLGQIVSKLSDLNILQETLIYLTSDHGFDENGLSHFFAPDVFLATNDKNVKRNGDQVDVAPTVYYGLGMWGILNPLIDGYPLQVNLPDGEEQKRQSELTDETPPAKPSIIFPTDGANLTGNTIITFSASDKHLSAVLLLIDNNLKTSSSLTWNYSDVRTAYGSYEWNSSSISIGFHAITILAFDEHGALNSPSSNTIIVNVSQNVKPNNDNSTIILEPETIAAGIIIVITLIAVSIIAYRKRSSHFKSAEKPLGGLVDLFGYVIIAQGQPIKFRALKSPKRLSGRADYRISMKIK